jgi:hypothetical protein
VFTLRVGSFAPVAGPFTGSSEQHAPQNGGLTLCTPLDYNDRQGVRMEPTSAAGRLSYKPQTAECTSALHSSDIKNQSKSRGLFDPDEE